jgi:hypothetical protein
VSKNQKSTKQQEKKIEKRANKDDSAKELLEIANQNKKKTYHDSIINKLFTGFDAEYIVNSIDSDAKYGFELTKESVDSLSNIANKILRMMNDGYLSANKGQIYVDIKNKLEGIDKSTDNKVYNRTNILNEVILKASLKKNILKIIEIHLDLNFNNNLPQIRNIINDGVNCDVIKKDYSKIFSENQEKNKKRIAILTFKPNEELKQNIIELFIKKIENQAPEYSYILERYNKYECI